MGELKIKRYRLSGDGRGLMAYTEEKGVSFHIHSNELSPLEKWIKKLLTKLDRYI